ncbi:MAG: ATP-binding protein [Candidatus Marinimicrobia bacterium]|jgi:serine/threonine-protein kinase RsbW|nr:ATP-binding protein [Candidatus Neomarinimicrobiota bacterium]
MDIKTKISIINQIPEIEKVCDSVSAFGEENGLSTKIIFAFHLALDEILTNIISYGYRDKDEHVIDINLSLQAGALALEILDDSVPFDPSEAPVPDINQPLEERKIGGLGIYLVKNLMDEVEYKSKDGINRLTLKKKF